MADAVEIFETKLKKRNSARVRSEIKKTGARRRRRSLPRRFFCAVFRVSGFFVFRKVLISFSKVKIKVVFRKICKWILYIAATIVVIFSGIYIYLAAQKGAPAPEFTVFKKTGGKPLVIAHRGGKGIAPENTLAAFERSRDLGVDVLELDVHATKDGELVVIHDKTVDRTTDGTGAVAELTLSEIQKLDAGFRWTSDGGKTFPFRGKGVKIPTLREVFEKFPEMQINIEPKHETPAPAAPLCRLIHEFERTESVVVGSFSDKNLEDFRAVCPEVATSASPSEASGFLARFKVGLTGNYTPRMQALQVPPGLGKLRLVTKAYIEAAHERNLVVHVWTINDEEEMKRLIEMGADGIMTDYPDRLIRVLGK